MHVEKVEIYSDKTNSAVLRHPGRKFPGILIQGDNLHLLCQVADKVCSDGKASLAPETYADMNRLRNALWDYLTHYKVVLGEHDIRLPFSEQP
jgi:hypothetical protein